MNPIEQTVFITYDTDVTEALKLGERLKAIYGVGEVRIVKSGSNIKRLLGENVLGLFFTGKERS